MENAFSKVILIVLPNGKVTVEVDTTKPDLILTEKPLDEDKLLQVSVTVIITVDTISVFNCVSVGISWYDSA